MQFAEYLRDLSHDRHGTPHHLVWITGSQDLRCSEGIPDPWLVGDVFNCAPVYNITQADIDAGGVTNNVRWVVGLFLSC